MNELTTKMKFAPYVLKDLKYDASEYISCRQQTLNEEAMEYIEQAINLTKQGNPKSTVALLHKALSCMEKI